MGESVRGGRPESARGRAPSRVRIVTDSTSDILQSHARAVGIIVVPNWIVLDGAALRDGIDISASQFYARLPRARVAPRTEPASAEDFYATYQAAFSQGATAIVSIHVSGRLSPVVRHAQAARDALAPAPIEVIDSQQTGIAMWPAVTRAAALAGQGAPVEGIHAHVMATLARTRGYVMVESLEPLRRAGRIGRARRLLGGLLDAHPILTLDAGEVTPVETARPRVRALQRMRDLVRAEGEIETLIICGTGIEAIAEWEALLVDWYAGPILKTWLGPTNGANLGPAVAVAAVTRG